CAPPDVKISDVSFGGVIMNPAVSAKGSFWASAKIKNLGKKTITKVKWDFILFDLSLAREYDRFKFVTDDKPIEPGKTKRLVKNIEYYHVPKYVERRVRITTLEYQDGTRWECQPPEG